MNIGGAILQCLKEKRVYEPDDGCLIVGIEQVARLFEFMSDVIESFRLDIVHDGFRAALCLVVGLVDRVENRARRHDYRVDPALEERAQVGRCLQRTRVANRDFETTLGCFGQRQAGAATSPGDRHPRDQIRVDFSGCQTFSKGQSEGGCQFGRFLRIGQAGFCFGFGHQEGERPALVAPTGAVPGTAGRRMPPDRAFVARGRARGRRRPEVPRTLAPPFMER